MDRECLHACSFPGCSSRFSKPSRLLHHERTHTGERPYLCPHEGCSKSYTRPAHLNRHLQSHKKEKCTTQGDDQKPKLKCDIDGCSETFTCKLNLEKHKHRFHEKLYKCPIDGCGQVFKKHNLVKCHMAEHNQKNPFECKHEGCSKSFRTRQKLKSHEKTHEGFMCDDCGKRFEKWSLFRKHRAVDHKPVFKCEVCEKTFATKRWLKQHAKTHLEVRELFHCTYEGCPRVYYCNRNLNAHIRSYHEGQRLSCPYCDRTFVNKPKLHHHMKLHDPNRPMPKKKPRKSSRKIPLIVKLSGVPSKEGAHGSKSVKTDSEQESPEKDVEMCSQQMDNDTSGDDISCQSMEDDSSCNDEQTGENNDTLETDPSSEVEGNTDKSSNEGDDSSLSTQNESILSSKSVKNSCLVVENTEKGGSRVVDIISWSDNTESDSCDDNVDGLLNQENSEQSVDKTNTNICSSDGTALPTGDKALVQCSMEVRSSRCDIEHTGNDSVESDVTNLNIDPSNGPELTGAETLMQCSEVEPRNSETLMQCSEVEPHNSDHSKPVVGHGEEEQVKASIDRSNGPQRGVSVLMQDSGSTKSDVFNHDLHSGRVLSDPQLNSQKTCENSQKTREIAETLVEMSSGGGVSHDRRLVERNIL